MTTISITANSDQTLNLAAIETQVILNSMGGDNSILFSTSGTDLQILGAGIGNAYFGGAGGDRVMAGGAGPVFGTFHNIETLIGNGQAEWAIATPGNWTVGGVSLLQGNGSQQVQLTGAATMTISGIDTLLGTAAPEQVTLFGGGALFASAIDTIIGTDDDTVIQLLTPQAGGLIQMGDGQNILFLADGANDLTTFNIDYIVGGTGADRITLGNSDFQPPIFVSGIETLVGTGGEDVVILDDSSTITVSGLDLLLGSMGDDWVTLAAPTQRMNLDLGPGNNRLQLADGPNEIIVAGVSTIIGGSGEDAIVTFGDCGCGPDLPITVAAVESLINAGGSGGQVMFSGPATTMVSGYDSIMGSSAAERITLADGFLTFASDIDTVIAAPDTDIWLALVTPGTMTVAGLSAIIGSTGTDLVTLSGPTSMIVSQVETVVGSTAPDTILTEWGADLTVFGVETILGAYNASRVTLGGAGTTAVSGLDTLLGTGAPQWVNLTDAGTTLSVGAIETLVGGLGPDRVTLLQAQSGAIVNLVGGNDSLTLADGGNNLSVYNVETLVGGGGADRVVLGGFHGNTIQVSAVQTLIGGSTHEMVTLAAPSVVTVADISTLTGSTGVDLVTVSGGGALTVSGVDTLVGTMAAADNTITLAAPQTGIMVNTLFGNDRLILADGPNTVSAFNVETLTGGSGLDRVTMGGHFGVDALVSGVETLIGGTTADRVTLSGAATMLVDRIETLVGSTAPDSISLSSSADSTILVSGIETITGSFRADMVTISGGGTVTVGQVDTLLGTLEPADLTITLATPKVGAMINTLFGNDSVTLANGTNTLSAFNVETLIGGTGADNITLGGHFGVVTQVSGVETITGNSTADLVTLAGNATTLVTGIDTLVGTGGSQRVTLANNVENSMVVNGIDTLIGSARIDYVTMSGGGAMTVSGVDTLVGTLTPADDTITLATAQTDIMVNPLFGNDTLILADGGNRLSAFNVESLLGGAGPDQVQLGGHFGITTQVANVETLIGASTIDNIVITSGDTLVLAGSGPDNITLRAGAGIDRIGYFSQLEGSDFGDAGGGDRVTNFQPGVDAVRIMAGGLLESAIDKGSAGTLTLTQRGQGQADLSSDEIVYLTQAVAPGGLANAGFGGFLDALGPVGGSGPVVVFANDGTSSGMYYLNDFGAGTIGAGNIRLMGLYHNAVIGAGDILFP